MSFHQSLALQSKHLFQHSSRTPFRQGTLSITTITAMTTPAKKVLAFFGQPFDFRNATNFEGKSNNTSEQLPRAAPKTGIEIYSVNVPSSSSRGECEFIAPHAVETLIGAEGRPASVLYFAPSQCVCNQCHLSERLELRDPQVTRNCLS
jgi:hypothetical protein